MSVLGTYFGGMIVDQLIFGMNIKRRVCIISPKIDQILDFILYNLNTNASVYDATGGYDKIVRKEINTIMDNQEYKRLMDYLKKTDPDAFVTVYSVNAVSSRGKK